MLWSAMIAAGKPAGDDGPMDLLGPQGQKQQNGGNACMANEKALSPNASFA